MQGRIRYHVQVFHVTLQKQCLVNYYELLIVLRGKRMGFFMCLEDRIFNIKVVPEKTIVIPHQFIQPCLRLTLGLAIL